MPYFILDYNRNDEGYRTVHEENESCKYLPDKSDQLALGFFENCEGAMQIANNMEDRVKLCKYCCKKEEAI